ncbi:YihY/virulence factor BrkB family protein [Actinoplanes sp. NPDC051513]|uniref:YihY/virulence factor BrkB family protein n=1 Tax=Actinoplanes sp. NPDC051513 TaxID=3363908 RepID=UPI00378B048C
MDADRGLAALPGWLRPRAGLVLASWFGRLLLRFAGGLINVQIFDRSMTLAAQAFTSIFPLLIMFGALLGAKNAGAIADTIELPDSSRQLLSDALDDTGFGTFGVLSALIVLVSATGLARAMVRAYAAVWGIAKVRSGPAAAARWLLVVLLLSGYVIGSRMIGRLGDDTPLPLITDSVALFVADVAITILLPMMLLGGAVPARRLVPGGLAFGLIMLAVRPAGHIYLPRALRSSSEHYGTIGLAFTYIGWLYIISFCLLGAAVIGQVLAEDRSLFGQVVRGEAGLRSLSVAIRARQLPAVRDRRVQHDGGQAEGDDRPDRVGVDEGEVDHESDAGQDDREAAGPDLTEHEAAADDHEDHAEDDVDPAEGGEPDVEQQVGPGALEGLRANERKRPDGQVRAAQEQQH